MAFARLGYDVDDKYTTKDKRKILFTKEVIDKINNLTPGGDVSGKQDKATTGNGAPSIIPSYIGQEYIDLANRKVYIAIGTEAANDWMFLNLRGGGHTITFKNYDGTILETKTVEDGETPVYTGPTPTRSYSVGYGVFLGFGNIVPATEDAEYIAQFVGSCQGPCEDGFHVPSKTELEVLKNMIEVVFDDGSSLDMNALIQYIKMGVNKGYYQDGTTGPNDGSFYWSRDIDDSASSEGGHTLRLSYGDVRTAQTYAPSYCSVRGIADDQSYDYNDYNLIYNGRGEVYKHKTENKLLVERSSRSLVIAAEDCQGWYQQGNNYGFTLYDIQHITDSYTSKVDVSQIQPSTYSDSKPFYNPSGFEYFWTRGTNWYGLWGGQIVY